MKMRFPSVRHPRLLFFLLIFLGTLAGYLRIHTYATGQDPRTFLMLANGILTGRETVDPGFVVPGWPLVLAGVIKLFGLYAAFWTNVPLFALLVWTVFLIVQEVTGSFRRGVVVSVGSALLLLGGTPVNPHFLLWVFRQTPMYLTAALAWLCLLRAVARQAEERPWRAVGWLAGTLAALAAGELVRETGALIVPGMGLYLLAVGSGWAGPAAMARKPARVRWFLFALSAGLGVVALCAGAWIVWHFHLQILTGQAAFLVGVAPALLHTPILQWPMMTMLEWIPIEFGWIGTACVLLGIFETFRCRRFRDFLFVFLLSAMAYLVFDGLIKFHMRFFLSTLFFLAPLAMLGAITAGKWIWKAADRLMGLRERTRAWRERAGEALWPALCVVLLVWAVATVLAFKPWGMRVSRADVERALEVLGPWNDPARPLLVDGRARYLTDVVEVFTDWPLEKVLIDSLGNFQGEPPWVFVQPMDRAGIYAPAGDRFNRADEVLENHMEVDPLPGVDEFSLDVSSYKLMYVKPWSHTNVSFRLPQVPDFDPANAPPALPLRLLVPSGAADQSVRFSFRGHPLREARLHPEYWFLAVPTDLLAAACEEEGRDNLELVMEADSPLPLKLQPAWLDPQEPFQMLFGPKYRPNCDAYLSEEFQEFAWLKNPVRDFPPWPAPQWAREFAGEGDISLPAGLEGSEESGDLIYVLVVGMKAVYGDEGARMSLTLSLPDFPEVAPQTSVRPHSDQEQMFRFAFSDLPRSPERLHVHVEHEVEYPANTLGNPRHSNAQLGRLWVVTLRRRDSLSIPVGMAGDKLFLGSGFYGRENTDSSLHGRWTLGRFEILLPLRGGRDYRLRLDYDELRPEDVQAAQLQLDLDGHPLETTPTETGLEARIPADCLDRINRLTIQTDTWSPGSHHGSSDTRQLGVYLRNCSVGPLDPVATP